MTSVTRSSRSRQRPPTLQASAARLIGFWRSFFAPGDLPTLIITVTLLLMPALSLSAAGWPLAMNTLIPVLILSVLFGFLLARSQYNELIGLLIGMVYGGCFILLIAAINDPGDLGEGIYSVFSRLFTWIIDATNGGINQDELVFTLLVSSLFWFLGYNAAWHLFRVDRVWRAVLPPALILITNAVYYTGAVSLEAYLIIFVFLTLLLIVRSNLDAREYQWYVNGIRVPQKLRRQVFRIGAVLALAILAAAWVIPSRDVQERLQRFQEFLQTDPLTQMAELYNRLFASAETQGPTTADYYGGDSLQLSGAIRLGDEMVFLVDAPQTRRYYWRSRVYDNYDNGRWTSAADTRLTDPEAPLEITHEAYFGGARVPVQQEFVMGLSASRLIYTAPQPLRVDLPTRTDLRYTDEDQTSMIVSVIRPMRVLYEGESYTVTSLLSSATADQLRLAGTAYPAWADTRTDGSPYSAYIPTMTSRTVALARTIVDEADATTPYDQARAVEAWLRANIQYNEAIPNPPEGVDQVDWFLFDIREGYCNYYSSAMVLMLRSLNIPARMAGGFAQGTWDQTEGGYIVREKDAHTWVEVYFPGYGWIEFEPTSAQAPVNRGDLPQEDLPPTSTDAAASATPTVTPSPTATSTPSAQPSVDPAQPPTSAVGQEQPQIPTATPTPSPTATATPVILPTQPPSRPQPRDPFSLFLPAIGALLGFLLILALIVVVALFIYWWWEWRGMRGMNPILRAYARLERYLPLAGIRTSAEQTPEERRQTIVRELPLVEPPVSAITRLYTVERYSAPNRPGVDKASRSETADQAWGDTRGKIVGRWARRTFLPFLRQPTDENARYQRKRRRKRE